MSARRTVLVVDDEPAIRFGIRSFLESRGYEVQEADSCHRAEEVFRALPPDVAILDYSLPDGNAIDLLRTLKRLDSSVPLLVLTGHGSIDLAVRAIKEGAEQFLTKPLELPALAVLLERLIENQRNRQKLAGSSRTRRGAPDPFLGESPAMRGLASDARKLLASDSPILILGETGVGKGVLARWLHDNGARAQEALVDLNCASLSKELLEAELFGHEKGAFTGAVASKLGLLEIAHRGTVFLDEIGDMDVQVQPRLLKVLEEKRFRRLGDVRDRRVDIRLLAATHQDLPELVKTSRFRADLYYRISTIALRIPPLRERGEDIPILARGFLRGLAADLGRGPVEISSGATDALRSYGWPGNIRELRNVLERALLLSESRTLEPVDLRFEQSPPPAPGGDPADLSLAELERRHIARVLQEEDGHVERAAKRLGVPRSTLYQKIKTFRIVVRSRI